MAIDHEPGAVGPPAVDLHDHEGPVLDDAGGGTPAADPPGTGNARRWIVVGVVAALVVVAGGTALWWFALRSGGEASTGALTMADQVVEVTSASMGETVSAEGTVAAAAPRT